MSASFPLPFNASVHDVPATRAVASASDRIIIEALGLTKVYGAHRALADVNLQVQAGTVGLLGPNGAGKSTFINCLLNLETPTNGTASVLG
jgi:ABC-2 type transport system ATP-binding protein